jgi:hypothetical protein
MENMRMRRVVGGTSLALLLLLAPAVGRAASVDQTAAKQLFEIPHMDEVVRGNRIHYKFERKVSLPEYPAPGYTDKIHVDVTKVEPDGKRDVALQVFSGPRAKHVWEETGMTGNPLLGWYLDNSINQFRAVAGGDRDFLKNNFKIAIRDKAKHEEIKATWKGKEVDAMRVTIVPYAETATRKRCRAMRTQGLRWSSAPACQDIF